MSSLNARIGDAGGVRFRFHALRNGCITAADRDLMLPASLTGRPVNHARPRAATGGTPPRDHGPAPRRRPEDPTGSTGGHAKPSRPPPPPAR